MGGEERKPSCPRCGLPIERLVSKKVFGRVYIYAYHRGGRQCYLGPEGEYVLVSKLQPFTLYPIHDTDRLIDYTYGLLESITHESQKLTKEQIKQIIEYLHETLEKLEEELKRREGG